jgi:hypothetical protein
MRSMRTVVAHLCHTSDDPSTSRLSAYSQAGLQGASIALDSTQRNLTARLRLRLGHCACGGQNCPAVSRSPLPREGALEATIPCHRWNRSARDEKTVPQEGGCVYITDTSTSRGGHRLNDQMHILSE